MDVMRVFVVPGRVDGDYVESPSEGLAASHELATRRDERKHSD
jgi:hypothetical protein